MVNTIKEIIERLDGYSFDGQGFAVTSFATVDVNGGSGTKLHVKPYLKNKETEGIPEEEHLMEMIKRLLSQYSDAPHYTVYKAEKVSGFWELVIQEIQEEDKTDEVKE